jgi:hypothetical protein
MPCNKVLRYPSGRRESDVVLLGAAHVLFSDYNREVIELATIPNVIKNVPYYAETSLVTFYSGDWALVSTHIQKAHSSNMKYDLILTAETLYTEAVSEELFQVLTYAAFNNAARNVATDASATLEAWRYGARCRKNVLLWHRG